MRASRTTASAAKLEFTLGLFWPPKLFATANPIHLTIGRQAVDSLILLAISRLNKNQMQKCAGKYSAAA